MIIFLLSLVSLIILIATIHFTSDRLLNLITSVENIDAIFLYYTTDTYIPEPNHVRLCIIKDGDIIIFNFGILIDILMGADLEALNYGTNKKKLKEDLKRRRIDLGHFALRELLKND